MPMLSYAQTIFAPATAPGRSGVAVMRLSGPSAFRALEALGATPLPPPRRAALRNLRDPETGEIMDRALVLRFPSPASFTGEDVAELHLHGSQAVLRHVAEVLGRQPDMRPAAPGEFTRRAFLNGRMDLLEAEGLADLIDAQTQAQKRQALRQASGAHGKFFQGLRVRVVRALAHMEAYIDFPDEDIPQDVLHEVESEVLALHADIARCLDDGRAGEKLREGSAVVILGAPNVGKSSLLNLLSGREAAIVSHRAGTTRDVIEVQMEIEGAPVLLTDTAGLRDSGDDIEQEGIRRALQRAENADIRIVMFDAITGYDAATQALIDKNSLVVMNKCEGRKLLPAPPGLPPVLPISCKAGQGINALIDGLAEALRSVYSSSNPAYITRERHRQLLQRAQASLERFSIALPLELACEELRDTANAIGEISGKITTEELLDEIFRNFCIGK